MLTSSTRFVSEIGTGLTGIGTDSGARIQVMAVINEIRTNLWDDILLVMPLVLVVSVLLDVIRFMTLK